MEMNKAPNLIEQEDEIFSRPPQVWFQSKADSKRKSDKAVNDPPSKRSKQDKKKKSTANINESECATFKMASCFRSSEENDFSYTSQKILQVTILASEWGSSKGGLSTINRELAIELAKWPEVQITLFMPQCSEEDKQAALDHKIRIVKAERRPGYDELEWLSFPPDHMKVDVIVGHGVKLGRQAQVIRESHNCKWVQVVHTDPEELGMFKSYQNPISTGEKKHKAEVELCEMADFVVGVGPKLSEAFRSYLRWCKKDQTILDITPGVFHEFVDIEHAANEREWCSVLVFGRGDAEDFQLKGFDIAGSAVAELDNTRLIFVGAPEGKHEEIKERFEKCGVPKSRLKIRSFLDCRESLRRLFYEVDLTLMPSRTEGFGLTGLEALSAGVPVLVSSNSGFGEALSQTPFGSSFVINSEDPKVWAAEMKKIWTKDRQQRLQEAKVLRTCYESEYSWSNQCKILVHKIVSMCHGIADASAGASSHSTVSATSQALQTMNFTSEKLHTEHCRYEGRANFISETYRSKVSVEISSFESDITFFAKRHDPDTRQWFFDDFNAWFRDPGDSRAYVLLGDPGVGKSVIAGALAQRMRETGQLGAAYFCRHDDGTRNDPRYLLGTVAHQLCACNDEYKEIVRGEDGVKMLLGNSKLGVKELFTKLLHEPLSKSSPCHQKLLVIIDALDETEHESREDFLDLIKHRFPLLPEWLVFFVTSRPEDSVQSRLKRYNPCIKICVGTSDQQNCYQKHQQDIQKFLKKRIQFSRLAISVDDVSKKCDGLFLYAQYIVEELKDAIVSGKKISNLSDLFPGDIDEFFLQNFERVCVQVGENIFKKLFGCAIVAPSQLPVSIISYILQRENSTRHEQQVVDAISQFVVLRSADQTLTFLHSLVPAWLLNKSKARQLFIDKKTAVKYIRDIFVEIVTSFTQNSPVPRSSIDVDLLNYVVRFAVRFLCKFGGKDSFKPIFNCLTNYQYIERRLHCGKIEIYHLIEDFHSAVELLTSENKQNQTILHEICAILTSNALILSEWPHLLHTCLRSGSAVLPETVLVSEFSGPCLECNFSCFVDSHIADMQCFASSSSKKLVAGSDGHFLLLFDASKALSLSYICRVRARDKIKHIEFSPDEKFIFFGHLHEWFSVERRCVKTIPQFFESLPFEFPLYEFPFYQWGVFTRDRKYIVVKEQRLQGEVNCRYQSCIAYLITLWALKEIEQSQDEEMTVRLNYQEVFDSLIDLAPLNHFFERLGVEPVYDWLPFEERTAGLFTNEECLGCMKLRLLIERNREPPLESVRLLILELYPSIFQYQVWDVQTGKPMLKHLFAGDAQLDAFTYISHFGYVLSDFTTFSGIDEARSICNIAVLRAICRTTRLAILCWDVLRKEFQNCEVLELELEHLIKEKCSLMPMWNLEIKRKEVRILQEMLRPKSTKTHCETWDALSTLRGVIKYLETEKRFYCWHNSRDGLKSLPPQELTKCNNEEFAFLSLQTLNKFNNEKFIFDVCANIPKGFQNLVNEVKGEIRLHLSPEKNWIVAADDEDFIIIIPRNQETFLNDGETARRIIIKCKWFSKFTFTNDDLFFIYTADGGVSLCALSLQTGLVLTSVTGCKPHYFSHKGQFGYLFRGDTEEKAIFLSNLFCPFMISTELGKSVSTLLLSSSAFTSVSVSETSVVSKSVATVFYSMDSVINVTSDSEVVFWRINKARDDITIKSQYNLPQKAAHIKNCVCSPSGRLIAIHKGVTVNLYILTVADTLKVLHEIDLFEAECENTTVFMTFSFDSTSLLLCVQDFRLSPLCFVWDVQGKSRSGNFRSQTLLTINCCCLSSCKTKLILCGEYQIEIWKYNEDPCRLLSRLGVEKPYQSVSFRQCCVSLDDEFLACCIANRILVYNLNASHINSSKQVLRGHLGRIDFCKFLRVNRYLVSNSTDGMVFLWDMSGFKAVGFAKIAQGEESILSMAVSPEEDQVVCFNSSGRVCLIGLRGLGSALVLKTALSLAEGRSRVEIADTSLRLAEEIVSTSREPNSVIEDDEIEEAESTSDSEEDMYFYYLEHESLVDSDDEC